MTTLNFEKEDISVLKNFCNINSSLVFNEGNELKTCNTSKSIVAVYKFPGGREVPEEFGIYDLKEFVRGLSLFDEDTYIEFDDDKSKVEIKFGGRTNKIRYSLCNIDLVKREVRTPVVKFPIPDYKIKVSAKDIKNWKSISSNSFFNTIRFKNEGNKATITIFDNTNRNKDYYSEETIAFNASNDLDLYLSVDDLVFLDGDYDIEMSSKNICAFNHMEHDLIYYVALQYSSLTP